MIEQAMEKLTSEMAAHADEQYVQYVGQYLVAHLESNPDHAEQILAEDKTILKSLGAMERYAKTKTRGRVAVLTDEQGFAVVLQYFGCWDGEPIELPPEPQPRPAVTPTVTNRPSPGKTNADVASRGKRRAQPECAEQMSLFDFAQEANN